MANEFIIKNGFRSQGNSEITGSLNVTGGIIGTASLATTASYINPLIQNVEITGSLLMSSSNAIRFNSTSSTNANYGDLSVYRYSTYDTPALRLLRPDGIGFTLYRQGTTNNFWIGDQNGDRNMTLYSNNIGAWSISAPGSGGDFLLSGGDATNPAFASSIVLRTNDNIINAATSSDHSVKIQGPNVTGSNSYNMVSIQAGSTTKEIAAIKYDGGAYFSGSVGIGTISPTKALTVQANFNDEGILLRSSTGNTLFQVTRDGASNNTAEMFLYSGGAIRLAIRSTSNFSYFNGGNFGFGTATDLNARLGVRGSGTTNATTTFLLQNSTPTNLMTVLDNGQTTFSSPVISLTTSQSAFTISQSISASNTVGGQYYGVNITPTFFSTTSSQTETALRVAATFTGSAASIGGQNIIADFGATSAGSQFTVTDVTSGSIYMVNDVSGLPIIEATSDWTVNMYNYPNLVFNKTGSQVNIFGTLRVSGSFILPLSQSATPQTGSAYWSGSFLFVYDGTQYRSSSFA